MKNTEEKFDIAIIGGGPAGIISAIRAAELGAKVVLIEKNQNLGKKLLITGKGRCNITQAEFNNQEFIKKLGPTGKFLFSALNNFGPQQVIEFFEEKNLPLKIERGQRVFPASDRAQDVLNTLHQCLRENKVKILYDSIVVGFELKDQKIKCLNLKGQKIYANNFILCTGGKAYPATGSTGDGYRFAKQLGHEIIPPYPALVPIKVKESWFQELQGLSLKNVTLNVFQNNKKVDFRFGEMLFTHFGISGPIVLDLSKNIGKLLPTDEVILEIDLKPALDFSLLDKRLQKDFEKNKNKNFENYLPELVPKKLIPIILKLSAINAEKKIHSITKKERKNLIQILKNFKLTAIGVMGFDQAIITTGGINLKEVDSKTMRSKVIPNLFFAGEILDLDGPTGGYNLQICWSTGYAAGTYAASKTN